MKIASKNVNKDLIFAKENKEDEKKKRKLIMIDYTEEEKLSIANNEYDKNEKEVQSSVDATQGEKSYFIFTYTLLCFIFFHFVVIVIY